MEQLEHEGFCRTKSFQCHQFCLVAACAWKGTELWNLLQRERLQFPYGDFSSSGKYWAEPCSPCISCALQISFSSKHKAKAKLSWMWEALLLCCRMGMFLAVTPSIASGEPASPWQLPAKQLGVMLSLGRGTARTSPAMRILQGCSSLSRFSSCMWMSALRLSTTFSS